MIAFPALTAPGAAGAPWTPAALKALTLTLIFNLALSLPLAAGESAASAPNSAAEAKMLIERTKQEIAQEEKAWSEEVVREKEAESRRRQRFSEFSQDRNRMQQTLAAQEEKLKETLAKMEAHQYRDRDLQARFKQLSQVLSARTRELRAALALGLPYRMDKRLESLDLLVRDLEGGNISPEEAMNRLWAFEQSERRLAQEAEVFSGDFTGAGDASASSNSDPIQVQYLRVGKQLLAFSSLDGTKLGVMRRMPPDSAAGKASYAWVRESEMDREMRLAVKEAIATAQGKSVPGFVPLPVWKAAFAEWKTAIAEKPAIAMKPATAEKAPAK